MAVKLRSSATPIVKRLLAETPVASGDLASTAAGKGASLVGIEDAGSIITAATVEGALQENRAAIDAIEADYLTSADIGVTIQGLDAELTALAGLVSAADKLPYFTGSGAASVADLSAFGRTLIDDASESAARTTLGVAIGTDVQAWDADLDNLSGLATDPRQDALAFTIDGNGSLITTGVAGYLEVPFDCAITRVTALADQSGSIVVDIWSDAYSNFPPDNADSITASAPVTISTAQKSQDATLTGWSTSLSAGDILAFNVDSVTALTRVTISLLVTRA